MTGLRTYVGKQPFPKRLTDDDLRAIHTPTLILFGEKSPVNNAHRAAERSRNLIADVETEVVPDAGHMLPVEQPTLFTSRVLASSNRSTPRQTGTTVT